MVAPAETVIRAGSALVGSDLHLEEDVVVVVRGQRIASIGKVEASVRLDAAGVIDLPGVVLMPGFIDAHVHIGFYDPAELLAGGITTARDLGWPPEEIWPLVDRCHAAGYVGPTIVAAGPMLTAEGGYPIRAAWAPPGTGAVVKGPDEARAHVRSVLDAGATIVKIALNPPVGPTLDLETLAAIVSAAHERGAKVTGHIYGLDELHKALEAGVDELAHMLMSEETIPEGTIRAMVDQGVVVVPTLSIRTGRDLEIAVDNLARFRSAGGTVVYGTDLGNEGPQPGIDANEVKGLRRTGMSTMEIVRSATVISAQWLGLEGRGVLAAGAYADIIGFEGTEPRLDGGAPAFVMREGAVHRK